MQSARCATLISELYRLCQHQGSLKSASCTCRCYRLHFGTVIFSLHRMLSKPGAQVLGLNRFIMTEQHQEGNEAPEDDVPRNRRQTWAMGAPGVLLRCFDAHELDSQKDQGGICEACSWPSLTICHAQA